MRKLSALAVLVMVIGFGACARNQEMLERPVTGSEFVLEIFNAQPRMMNVAFSIGGSTTALGSVAAHETKRWAIPNQGGDRILLTANDSTMKQRIEKNLDLDKGQVVRWEIR